MILEPVMMNAGIIPPDDGYLAGLRDLLHGDGAFLTFDEVKTGFTTGPGGVTARYGVVPDIVCLAKALGGGIAVAAIGGTDEVMSAIADGRYEQVGTFNGNPLAMAAARATLTEVLTAAGVRAPRRARRPGCATRARGHHRQARLRLARRHASGAKGCVTFRGDRCANSATSSTSTTDSATLHWLMQHNGGVFLPPWGKVEQWLLSVQHDRDDVDRFAANFARFAARRSRLTVA